MDAASTLAIILASIPQATQTDFDLCAHVAAQLAHVPSHEKPALALLLANLLKKTETRKEYPETVICTYIRSLISTANLDEPEQTRTSIGLAIELARNQPDLLLGLADETADYLFELCCVGVEAHVSSDDAFDADFNPFLLKYTSVLQEGSRINAGKPVHSFLSLVELHERVFRLLRFWHLLLLGENVSEQEHAGFLQILAEKLLVLLFPACGLRNPKLAVASFDVICILLSDYNTCFPSGSSETVWNAISILLDASSHPDLAYAVWLRWISASSTDVRPSQQIYTQENYWSFLQAGLATGFSERRKFCLHILMTSLREVDSQISNRFLQFNPSRRSQIEAAWAKYSTLIDITSVSSSVNQLRAAIPDLERLLAPSSPVSPSWLVVLVSLGLSSGSGAVQKLVWDFLQKLDAKYLERLFGEIEGQNFLQDLLLPYASIASQFSVQQSSLDFCEHGTSVSELLTTILGPIHSKAGNARAILRFLDKTEDLIFGPARTYILKGLVDGLLGHTIFNTQEDLAIISRVSKMQRSYGKMKTELNVTICMHLLLSVDVIAVGADEYLGLLIDAVGEREHLLYEHYLRLVFEPLGPYLKTHRISATEFFSQYAREAVLECNGRPSNVSVRKTTIIIYMALPVLGSTESMTLVGNEILSDKSFYLSINGLRVFSSLAKPPDLFSYILEYAPISKALGVIIDHMVIEFQEKLSDSDYIAELAMLLERLPQQTTLTYNDGKTLRELSTKSWIAAKFSAQEQFDVQVGTRNTNLLRVSRSCYRLLPKDDSLLDHADIKFSDVLSVVDSFPLPNLGANNHTNKELTQSAEMFIGTLYGFLNDELSGGMKREDEQLIQLFEGIPRLMRFLQSDALCMVLGTLQTICTKAQETVLGYDNLYTLLHDLWETVDATTLRTDLTPAYLCFSQLILHVTVLRAANKNEDMLALVQEITADLLRIGNGKRSIRPALSQSLRNAAMSAPDVVCASHWLLDLLLPLINSSSNIKDIEFALEPALATIFDDFLPGSDHYRHYYGQPEQYSCVFAMDLISRLDNTHDRQTEFAIALRERLFEPWRENYARMPVYVEWKKVSQLQALLLLERFLTPESCVSFLDELMSTVLAHEPHPRHRFLLEWIIAMCIVRHPDQRDYLWPYLHGENRNWKLRGSLLRVAVMVARELQPTYRDAYYTELVHTIVPFLSNNKVALRHTAIAMILELWDSTVSFGYTDLTSDKIFKRVRDTIANSEYYKGFSEAKDFRTFDAMANYTFAGIFAGDYLGGIDEVEKIPAEHFAAITDTLGQPARIVKVGDPTTKELLTTAGKIISFTKHEEEVLSSVQNTAPVSAPLQTKSGAWDARDLLASTVDAASRRANRTFTSKATKASFSDTSLIVIASLVENNFNLGGVSRVSEIMGVSTLCISSLAATKTIDFTTTSVHSEYWLPITEVAIPDIKDYLRKKRAEEGYTAVGVEQTDRSVVLGQDGWRFPKKTVLLLGTEKFGIPPELLGELDACVEIPQKGQTRSMNVQTAAAVVLYECCRQFRDE